MSGEQIGGENHVKIFVESAAVGVDGVERAANKWLENNPLAEVRSVQFSAIGAAYVITIWYSGLAPNQVTTGK